MRYFVLIGLFLSLTACVSDDARYYRLHPKMLQEVLKNCPQSSPKHLTCSELVTIAGEVNSLAYQLQQDPQGFGQTILLAQAKLAQLEADSLKNKTKSDLRAQIVQVKQQVAEYLAIVRWLESPEK